MNFVVDRMTQRDVIQILSTIPCIAFERQGNGHYIVHQNCLLNTWNREFHSELLCQGDPRDCYWHQLKSIQPELPGFQQNKREVRGHD